MNVELRDDAKEFFYLNSNYEFIICTTFVWLRFIVGEVKWLIKAIQQKAIRTKLKYFYI